jgi:hypothetical protein
VPVLDGRAQALGAGERAEDGERVALADAARAGERVRRAASGREAREHVEPARKQVGGNVREAVCGERLRRVFSEIPYLLE